MQAGKSPLEAIRNIPVNIREIRPTLLLSVPALAKTFRKGIEKGVRDKGVLARLLFRAGVAGRPRRTTASASTAGAGGARC